MNAVARMTTLLAPDAVRRLAALRVSRFATGIAVRGADVDEAASAVVARWTDDLCGLLNAMTRGELAHLAAGIGVDDAGRSPELRARLWEHGAAIERGDIEVSLAVQPRPTLLGGHLVIEAAPRGMYPPAQSLPRAIPPSVPARPPAEEPDSVDELLGAADRAIGVRLGPRGRDKGAWGARAQALLGVGMHNERCPDWRGDVEIKTVAIAREPATARWRIVDDPAIAMIDEPALAKLQRTLWLARADVGDGDATIVSWYLLEWDAEIARLAHRYLHARPKGPAGTDARALYLHRRFFADAGMLATLNGPPPP